MSNNLARQVAAREQARERQRTWGRGLSGRSSLPTPMYGRRTSGRPQPSVVVQQSIGETIHVRATDVEIPVGGGLVTWQALVEGHQQSGFGAVATPTELLKVSSAGYYRAIWSLRWHTWAAGGTVRLLANNDPLRPDWTGLRGRATRDVPVSTGLLSAGGDVGLWVDHGAATPQTLDARMSLELIEPAPVTVEPETSGGEAATEVTDDFNRANEDLDASANWFTVRDTAEVRSDEVFLDAGIGIHQTQLSSNDQFAQVRVVARATGGAGGAGGGVFVRCPSANVLDGGYYFRTRNDSSALARITASGGVESLAGQGGGLPDLPYTIRIEVVGNSIVGLVNGVPVAEATDDTWTSGRYHGLREGAGRAWTGDDYEAGVLA